MTASREQYPTRAAIARAVCTELDWRTPGGELKLMSARVALLRPLWQAEGSRPGYMDPALWGRYASWMLARHLIPKAVAVDQAMTDAFLPKS
jgi:hypothetical protein